MTTAGWALLLGTSFGGGLTMVVVVLAQRRRLGLEERVVPYLHDLAEAPRMASQPAESWAPTTAGWQVVRPYVMSAARGIERVLGGGAAVRRQLDRLGGRTTLEEFRVSQVVWGVVAFCGAAVLGLLWAVRAGVAPLPMLLFCCIAFAVGVIARDQSLTRAVRAREERITREFPTVCDLMALAVAAGEGPLSALERVVAVSHGDMSDELRRVLGEVRTGTRISAAFDALASRSGVASVSRFAEALAVAIDRGTPLVGVLHAQAADVRDASRNALIESGARREVAMMVPVVFLILPVTVVFAFWPGFIGLSLSA